jgi:hypothetical protein
MLAIPIINTGTGSGPAAGKSGAIGVVPLLLALAALAGCATRPPVEAPPPPPPGMERLIGQPAETALQLLGPARLDRREGPARHLQFRGACVLDIFYYPRNGQTPVATHAEARLPSGVASSPGDCFVALLKSRPTG